jgi:hypothetical protein
MKRTPTLLAASALAGSLLLATPAAANPRFDATVDGAPAPGSWGTYGQVVHYDFSGCTVEGQPGTFGQFVRWTSGPTRADEQANLPADDAGNFQIDLAIPLEAESLSLEVEWYCASQPVSERTDPAIVFLNPPVTFDIAAAPGRAEPNGARVATFAGTSSAAGLSVRTASGATDPSIEITVDQDALPAIDRMGITGPKAAALKAKVDAQAKKTNNTANRARKALGLRVQPITDADYVRAAFEVTAGKASSARIMAPYVAQLASGDLKVTVIEDVALRLHPAAWWNKR